MLISMIKVRLDSSLRATPGLVKLRQKIQLHATKLKPTDYVGFSKLPYQVGKKQQNNNKELLTVFRCRSIAEQ